MKKMKVLLVGLVLFVWSGSIHAAGIPVVDVTNFSQNIIQAVQAVQQVANQATQIANQVQQVQNQMKSLQTLGAGSFGQLTNNLTSQLNEISNVLANTQGIGYSLGNVQSQFETLFPKNGDWATIPTANHEQYYRDWNKELSQAALTAIQSQAALNRIAQNNQAAQSILGQSQGADGEVRQLQAVNEMLGVMTRQMSEMNQAVATNGRISATMAAVSASEKEAQMAASGKLWNNYNYKGPAASILSKPPGM